MYLKMPVPPNGDWGVPVNGCSAVSYFSTRVGSIIGAGRLSFRVRDGSGRFPAAVAAVTLFSFQPRCVKTLVVFLVVGCDVITWIFVVANECCGVLTRNDPEPCVFWSLGVCKFSAG